MPPSSSNASPTDQIPAQFVASARAAAYNVQMAIDITWLGRTAFRIRGREGTVITDPVPTDSGYRMGKVTADVVTVSNRDDARLNAVDLVGGSPRVLDAPGEYEVSGILVAGAALKTPSGDRQVAFVIELEGVRIGHLGLYAYEGKPELPDIVKEVDVLLMPVGGEPAMTARQAMDLMTAVDPSIAIPMFFKTDQEKLEIAPLSQFLTETGTKPEPQTRFSITKSGLPDALTVVVLQPRQA